MSPTASTTKDGSLGTGPPLTICRQHLLRFRNVLAELSSNRRRLRHRKFETSSNSNRKSEIKVKAFRSPMKTIMMFFTRSYRRKAAGWTRAATVTVFDHASRGIGDLTRTDTGSGPIAAGIGTRTSVSAGQRTITDDGLVLAVPDGAGYQDISGPQLGCLGEKVTNMLVGLLSRPKPMCLRRVRFLLGRTRIMALDRLRTTSSAILIGLRRTTRSTSSHRLAMFRSSTNQRMLRILSPTTR